MFLKSSFFTFLALLLSPILFAQDLLLTGVHVVSVETGQLLENRTIHVSDGEIKAIIQAGNLPQGSQNIPQIDGKGGFVFPGLAEFHAHLPVSTDGSTQLQEESMWLYLANGVVRIRSMLGHSSHLELRERINSGKLMGPRIVISGPSFSATTVTDPQQAADRVREQKQAGYDHLKIHPGLTLEEMTAIAQTAKQEQIPFGGHVPLEVGIRNALQSGFKSVEHIDGYMEGLLPASLTIDPTTSGPFNLNLASQVDWSKCPN